MTIKIRLFAATALFVAFNAGVALAEDKPAFTISGRIYADHVTQDVGRQSGLDFQDDDQRIRTVRLAVGLNEPVGTLVNVAWVAFEVDGVRLSPYSMSAPYTTTWDTAQKPGTHTLVAVASDWAGNTRRSAPVTVKVPTPPTAAAAYDFTLQVPACGAAGSPGCDSGTLLNGRGPVGPELYAPNTLQGACADGTSGTFHVDESVDRIRLFTNDGTPLAPGKSVRVEATVWAFSSFAEDFLDLYVAPDARSPVWSLVGTFKPVASGMNVLGTSFTLPASGASGLQALRARFRYAGVAAPCTSSGNTFDDHDDLVFRVAY